MAGAIWGAANCVERLPPEDLERLEQRERLLNVASALHARTIDAVNQHKVQTSQREYDYRRCLETPLESQPTRRLLPERVGRVVNSELMKRLQSGKSRRSS